MQKETAIKLMDELRLLCGDQLLFGTTKIVRQKLIHRYNQLLQILTKEKSLSPKFVIVSANSNTSIEDLYTLITLAAKYYQTSRYGK